MSTQDQLDGRYCTSCNNMVQKDNYCGCVICKGGACDACIISRKDIYTPVERLIANDIINELICPIDMWHQFGCICPDCLAIYEEAFIKTIPLTELPTLINHTWHTDAGTKAYKARYS